MLILAKPRRVDRSLLIALCSRFMDADVRNEVDMLLDKRGWVGVYSAPGSEWPFALAYKRRWWNLPLSYNRWPIIGVCKL